MRQGYGANPFEGFPEWDPNSQYSITEIVESDESLWQAKRDIDPSEEPQGPCGGVCWPSILYDIDGDNINDNPWQQLYPWEDGDYLIITPDKWFQDGDSWVADLSLLGKDEVLTDSMMDQIAVIPNPYIVSSLYNEEIYGEI